MSSQLQLRRWIWTSCNLSQTLIVTLEGWLFHPLVALCADFCFLFRRKDLELLELFAIFLTYEHQQRMFLSCLSNSQWHRIDLTLLSIPVLISLRSWCKFCQSCMSRKTEGSNWSLAKLFLLLVCQVSLQLVPTLHSYFLMMPLVNHLIRNIRHVTRRHGR